MDFFTLFYLKECLVVDRGPGLQRNVRWIFQSEFDKSVVRSECSELKYQNQRKSLQSLCLKKHRGYTKSKFNKYTQLCKTRDPSWIFNYCTNMSENAFVTKLLFSKIEFTWEEYITTIREIRAEREVLFVLLHQCFSPFFSVRNPTFKKMLQNPLEQYNFVHGTSVT